MIVHCPTCGAPVWGVNGPCGSVPLRPSEDCLWCSPEGVARRLGLTGMRRPHLRAVQ